jgi:hypothetical protein
MLELQMMAELQMIDCPQTIMAMFMIFLPPSP